MNNDESLLGGLGDLVQRLDETERVYAPQQLPPDDREQARVRAEGDAGDVGGATLQEAPDAAPVATAGSSPSSVAAPPNIGHEEHGGAPGDPNTQARDPFDTDETR